MNIEINQSDESGKKSEYVTRDAILKLLSDDEIARTSSMEAATRLAEGEEYVNLAHLDQGVLRMRVSTRVAIGQVLPRSAVAAETWSNICARLAKR